MLLLCFSAKRVKGLRGGALVRSKPICEAWILQKGKRDSFKLGRDLPPEIYFICEFFPETFNTIGEILSYPF